MVSASSVPIAERWRSCVIAARYVKTPGRCESDPATEPLEASASRSEFRRGSSSSVARAASGRTRGRIGSRGHRALAVPAGAQARRAPARRLAVRLPAPVPQVGQRGAVLRLRCRPAGTSGATSLAGLPVGHRACLRHFLAAAHVPARAANGTGINGAWPVDGLVLSGNTGIVLSGNRSSCYQATKSAAKPITARVLASLNFSNLNTLTFSRSAAPRWTTAKRQKTQQARSPKQPRFARRAQASFPAWRAAP